MPHCQQGAHEINTERIEHHIDSIGVNRPLAGEYSTDLRRAEAGSFSKRAMLDMVALHDRDDQRNKHLRRNVGYRLFIIYVTTRK